MLILNEIRKSPNGLTLSEILSANPDVARRTAQRKLGDLIHEGKIYALGQRRARKYFPVAKKNMSDIFPSHIPLSVDSREILAYVDQPVSARTPVGYQMDFLESYVPNKTFYLTDSIRRQLHKIGQTADENRPAGTYGRAILNRLLIDLSWASSHLEGNTYSKLDTKKLIEDGQAAEGKAAIETQMILNHKSAIELLVDNADTVGFNRYTLLNLHSALSENLLPNPSDEGRLRQHIVEIGRCVYRPLSVPSQISEMFDIILTKASEIRDPFEQSFFVMVHIPYLQPFADINKRTSRLSANLPLIRENLCPLTFLDVPEKAYSRAILGVYELNRIELLRDLYVWAYERSAQEYDVIKQEIVEPDPLRLKYRELLKKVISSVVMNPSSDPMLLIVKMLEEQVSDVKAREQLTGLVIDELKRLHEGTLARYGLRISEFEEWKRSQ